jgi:hypothetical protein
MIFWRRSLKSAIFIYPNDAIYILELILKGNPLTLTPAFRMWISVRESQKGFHIKQWDFSNTR